MAVAAVLFLVFVAACLLVWALVALLDWFNQRNPPF